MSFERIKQNARILSETIQTYKNLLFFITELKTKLSEIKDKKEIKDMEKEIESLNAELNKLRAYAINLCKDNSSVIKQEKINLIKNAANT